MQYAATPEDRINHYRTKTFLLATGILTRESGVTNLQTRRLISKGYTNAEMVLASNYA